MELDHLKRAIEEAKTILQDAEKSLGTSDPVTLECRSNLQQMEEQLRKYLEATKPSIGVRQAVTRNKTQSLPITSGRKRVIISVGLSILPIIGGTFFCFYNENQANRAHTELNMHQTPAPLGNANSASATNSGIKTVDQFESSFMYKNNSWKMELSKWPGYKAYVSSDLNFLVVLQTETGGRITTARVIAVAEEPDRDVKRAIFSFLTEFIYGDGASQTEKFQTVGHAVLDHLTASNANSIPFDRGQIAILPSQSGAMRGIDWITEGATPWMAGISSDSLVEDIKAELSKGNESPRTYRMAGAGRADPMAPLSSNGSPDGFPLPPNTQASGYSPPRADPIMPLSSSSPLAQIDQLKNQIAECYDRGDLGDAVPIYKQAMPLVRKYSNKKSQTQWQHNYQLLISQVQKDKQQNQQHDRLMQFGEAGGQALLNRDYTGAETNYQAAIAILRKRRDSEATLASYLDALARAQFNLKKYRQAETAWTESKRLLEHSVSSNPELQDTLNHVNEGLNSIKTVDFNQQ